MRTLAEIVPLRAQACREAVDAVAMLAAGEDGVDWQAASHVSICLRCQAEVAAYRRVLRTMRDMRFDELPTPPGGLAEALEALKDAAEGRDGADGPAPWVVRVAYLGGLTAASAAGMLVWMTRRRPGLLHAS